MPNTSVKYYTNIMQGAPQLTNDFGKMTALLDACLINGFNERPIQELTYSAGTATCKVLDGHEYQVGQVLLVSGADQAGYNGEIRVISTTTTTFTYAIADVVTSPATGVAMKVKVAPLGFELAFSEGSKRAYRSKNLLSNRPYLRVDDGIAPGYNPLFAKKAKVGIAQGMSDINTVVGTQAPFDPLNPKINWEPSGSGDGIYDGWYKWYYARYTYAYWDGNWDARSPAEYNRRWVLIGDDRGFYLITEYGNEHNVGRVGYCFTDFESYRQNDPFNTTLVATERYAPANSGPGWYLDGGNAFNRTNDFSGKLVMRDHTLLGGNQAVGFTSLNTNNGQVISGNATGIPFPNPVDYSLILHPTYLMQAGSKGLRGKMPGYMFVHNDKPLEDLEIVENVTGYPGRKFLLVKMAVNDQGWNASTVAFDITGPWW
jgi:hypothetical protein